MSEDSRARSILKPRTQTAVLLALICGLIIAAHRYQPNPWSPIGSDILHSLHGPGFAAVSLLILWFCQHRRRSLLNYAKAVAIAFGIALVSEASQIPGPREAQIGDIGTDALGIFGAVGVAAAFNRAFRARAPTWVNYALPVGAAAALAIACIPTAWFGFALSQQKRAFPTILDFEHRWESAAIQAADADHMKLVRTPDDWPTDSATVGEFTEHDRGGIFLSIHPPGNWRAYSSFNFLAASSGNTLSLDLCFKDNNAIGDQLISQYCTSLNVASEPREYVIPFSDFRIGPDAGPFDFSSVDTAVFSASEPGMDQRILIDNIRLEN